MIEIVVNKKFANGDSLVSLTPLVPMSPKELFSPMSPSEPLSPLVLLSTLPPLYDQCIIIVSNGSSLSPLAPMLPSIFVGYFNLHIALKWRHLNGFIDHHFSHHGWSVPLVPFDPSLLAAMDRHWHHLLSPLTQTASTCCTQGLLWTPMGEHGTNMG